MVKNLVNLNTMALKEKQIRFCEEYLIDLNATQAAIRAGYSEKTAHSIGAENLIKPEIQNYLQKRRDELANSLNITQERVLKELAAIAFSDSRKFFAEDGALKPITDLDDESSAAISGMDIEEIKQDGFTVGTVKKLKRWDKVKALDSLCRVLGYNAPEKKDIKVQKISLAIVRKTGTD